MADSLRIVFAGTPEFAARHLNALLGSEHSVVAVLSQPDRRSGRGKKQQPSPVKALALERGIDVLQPESLKDAEVQTSLAALRADVWVVVAYGLIIPPALLAQPRFGCLNVHASLLPRWRGAAPIQRAVEAGDTQSGITIMQMEAGLDTGPMLAVQTVDLRDDETGGSLHDRLAELGPPTLLGVLEDIERYVANAQVQDAALATYAHKITKQDPQIDWQAAATDIARRVRAFNPTPVCYSTFAGERVKFWRAEAWSECSDAAPGTLLKADAGGLIIACGEGCLRVTEAQFPGGRPMEAAALVNGRSTQLTPGALFLPPEPL